MVKRVKKKRKTVKVSHEILEQIGQLSLMNNAFMNLALKGNLGCVEEILRVILGKPRFDSEDNADAEDASRFQTFNIS